MNAIAVLIAENEIILRPKFNEVGDVTRGNVNYNTQSRDSIENGLM
jgi:hypothetical protein